jgi:isopenicillin-N epimerase
LDVTRRQMLFGAAGVFGFRDCTFDQLARLLREQPDSEDDDFWVEIRKSFDHNSDLVVFNHAGLSPSPIVVREAIAAETKRANADPSFIIWRRQDQELAPIRERLAKLVGCTESELALVPNCTYGLQTAIMGVQMKPGDRIVTTSHDYSRAITAIKQRERRDGIVSTVVQMGVPPEPRHKIVDKIVAAVDDRTKLVLLSQMTYVSGQIMPAAEIAEALKARGIPIFIDAAHGIGLLPETFSGLGCSIYAACLHKWLMGPVGTGVFAVRRGLMNQVWPLHPAEADLEGSATKFEQIGSHSVAPFLALKQTLDFHEMIGRERKAARLDALRNRLADKILNEPKVKHFGSLDPSVCRAVLLIGLTNVSAIDLAAKLQDKYRIHVTTMVRAGVDAIRISPNAFTTEAELEALATAIREIAKG